jgi:uncharacterized protein involved in response to NO
MNEIAQHTANSQGASFRSRSPAEIMDIARARERSLSRVLIAYVSSGLIFMMLPGTFLGVWNLLQISGRESAGSVSPAWLQAHGHAQVFGWIGSFILGIGFHSIPKRRGDLAPPTRAAWFCWIGWTLGVAMRWAANIYPWHWRVWLPVSAALELAAFLIFFATVSRHRPEDAGQKKLESWIWVVIAASVGFFLALAANLAACIGLAFSGSSPALPHMLDQRYLSLITWGFLVPFIWGFSARWMHVFLGLRQPRTRLLAAAVAVNFAGVVAAAFGVEMLASILFVVGAASAIAAIGMFQPAVREPKTRGVHASFPFFVRLAYAWMLIAGLLGIAAVEWDTSGGFWGASRHALTVGFIAMMVLCVGQRILPAFAGMRLLWSTRVMFAGLLLLAVGCVLRVSSEVLAYQGYAGWAWNVLPISAVLELLGITSFAVNIFGTFILEPSHAVRQPMTIELEQHASPDMR